MGGLFVVYDDLVVFCVVYFVEVLLGEFLFLFDFLSSNEEMFYILFNNVNSKYIISE